MRHFNNKVVLAILLAAILTLCISFASCKKNTTKNAPVTEQISSPCFTSSAMTVAWTPYYSWATVPKFNSDSSYYENSTYIGKWYLDCQTIYVKGTPANTFSFKIQSLTSDTLKVYTVRYSGCTIFYK